MSFCVSLTGPTCFSALSYLISDNALVRVCIWREEDLAKQVFCAQRFEAL